jgi:hypothetical protein
MWAQNHSNYQYFQSASCNSELSASIDFAEKKSGKGWEEVKSGPDPGKCQQVVTSGKKFVLTNLLLKIWF